MNPLIQFLKPLVLIFGLILVVACTPSSEPQVQKQQSQQLELNASCQRVRSEAGSKIDINCEGAQVVNLSKVASSQYDGLIQSQLQKMAEEQNSQLDYAVVMDQSGRFYRSKPLKPEAPAVENIVWKVWFPHPKGEKVLERLIDPDKPDFMSYQFYRNFSGTYKVCVAKLHQVPSSTGTLYQYRCASPLIQYQIR